MSLRLQSIKLELWIGKVKMNRRNFLQALVVAPAIVSAGNIMRVKPVAGYGFKIIEVEFAMKATKGTAHDQLIADIVSTIEFDESGMPFFGIEKKVTPDGEFYSRYSASMENGVINLTRTWSDAIT